MDEHEQAVEFLCEMLNARDVALEKINTEKERVGAGERFNEMLVDDRRKEYIKIIQRLLTKKTVGLHELVRESMRRSKLINIERVRREARQYAAALKNIQDGRTTGERDYWSEDDI